MKSIYVHCPLLPAQAYRQVLEFLSTQQTQNITVYIKFPSRVSVRDLEAVIQTQKDFAAGKRIRFQNHAVFSGKTRFPLKLRQALLKNGFSVELLAEEAMAPALTRTVRSLQRMGVSNKIFVDAPEAQKQVYETFAHHGLNVCFTDPHYDAQTPEWFDHWLFDPAARGVNTFVDIITMLTLQIRSPNCRHASCVGNTFYVDQNLDLYLCPMERTDRTRLGSIAQASSPGALFSGEALASLLTKAVQKRGSCAADCGNFPFCQGGCLLKEDDDCQHYHATVERIRQRLLEVYRDGKLDRVNYIVKNAILNALAFGTAFFKEERKENI